MSNENFDEDSFIIDEEFNLEDINEEQDLLQNNQDYKEKIRRTGVIYLSYIPEGMTVNLLREKLSNYSPGRIYLVPDLTSRKGEKRQNYKEGWVEFEDKMFAKLCEYELNGQQVGGKKRNNNLREEIWTIRYLHKFKWHHLMEKISHSKKLREQRSKAELRQAKVESGFILDKYGQKRAIDKLKKKRVK
jgi:ESF2/ABP1 family protein